MRDLHSTSAPPRGTAERRQASLGRSLADQSSVRRLCTTFTDSAVTAIVSLRSLRLPVQVGATSCRTSSTGSLYRCRKTASLTCEVVHEVSACWVHSCRSPHAMQTLLQVWNLHNVALGRAMDRCD